MTVVMFVTYEILVAILAALGWVHLVWRRRDRAQLAGAHRRLGTLAPIVRLEVPSRREIKRRRHRANRLGLQGGS